MPPTSVPQPMEVPAQRRLLTAAAVLLIVCAGVLAQIAGVFTPWDLRWLDFQFQRVRADGGLPSVGDPVIVGIDQEFLDSIDEPLALAHRQLAELLEAFALARPAVVALDVVLPNKRFDRLVPVNEPQRDYHRTLLEGLVRAGSVTPLVLAESWSAANGRFEDVHLDFRNVANILRGGGTRFASSMLCHEPDQLVRRFPGTDCQPVQGGVPFAAAAAAAAAMGHKEDWTGYINYGLGPELNYIPVGHVQALLKQHNVDELQRLLRGRAVFVGSVFENQDIHVVSVPLEKWRPKDTDVHGVSIHAQIFRSVANNAFIVPVEAAFTWVGVVIGAMFWLGGRQRVKLIALGGFIVAMVGLTVALFDVGYWLGPSVIIATAMIAASARAAHDAWAHYVTKRRLQQSFSGYVSPGVMAEIVSGRLAAQGNDRRHLAVLFSDIRNFTALSESKTPDAVVALLSRYFDRMTQAIHQQGGTLDKFMGDGIMALFGAPNPLPSPEQSALQCARDMLLELEVLNRAWVAEGQMPLAIGIGVHCGEAIVGNIGAGERHAYSAIGDTVNIASRLESLCKELGRPLVCSESTWRKAGCPSDFEDCDERTLRGHSAVRVYGLRSAGPDGSITG